MFVILSLKKNIAFVFVIFFLFFSYFSCLANERQVNTNEKSNLIEFNYDEPTSIKKIATFLSSRLQKNFIFDKNISGDLQILVPQKISVELAYEIFLSALNVLGLATIETGKITKIISNKKIKISNDLYGPNQWVPYSDSLISSFFFLKFADVSTVQSALSRVFDTSHMIVFKNENALLFTAPSFDVKRMKEIISILDVARGDLRDLDIIKPFFISAKKFFEKIKEMQIIGNSSKGNLIDKNGKVIIDELSNSIFIYGSKSFKKYIKDQLKLFDVEVELNTNQQVFMLPLDFVQAKKIQQTLSSIKIKAIDEDTSSKKDYKIVSHDDLNTLLIASDKNTFKEISKIVRKLDYKKPQVLIEIDLIELGINQGYKFSLSQMGVGKNFNDDLKIVSGWQGAGAINIVASQIESGNGKISNSAIKNSLKDFKEDLSVGVIAGKTLRIGNQTFSPTSLISAIKRDEYSKLITSPIILATSGEEAEMTAGEVQSFLSQEINSEGSYVTKVNKENIELSLNVTPKISKQEDVLLSLKLDFSSVIGVMNNLPQIAKRKIKQDIFLKNGQTAFISGFKSSYQLANVDKIPYLADIPLFGYFFKKNKKSFVDKKLLILMTPHIISKDADFSKIFYKKINSQGSLATKSLDNRHSVLENAR